MIRLFAIVVILILVSCSENEKSLVPNKRALKEELRQAEKAFADSCMKKGFYPALLDFAAEEVVMFGPGDTVLNSIETITKRAESIPRGMKPQYILTWSAIKIDVSADGELGYTCGWFQNTTTDQKGDTLVTHGLYSSIWKKIDGKWRVVVN